MDKEKTACFSGYRLEKMPQHGDTHAPEVELIRKKLQQAILDAIAQGYTHFICGMADGWDTWAYDTLWAIRRFRGDKITLEAAVPYHKELKGRDKRAYDAQLSYADKITVLSEKYHSGVFHVRNRYMIDNSSLLICYWDGKSGGTAYTVGYAEKQGLKIVNVAEEVNL